MTSLLAQLPPPPPGRSGWPWTEETPPSAYRELSHWPRISIVTPSFNQAAFIEETIRSILLQNYPNLHYMVFDGGSTDGTVEILRKYSPWLAHWESQPDRGQSHAINKGVHLSDGTWFNWINSDDCLLPGALAAVGRHDDLNVAIISGAQSTGASLSETVPLGRTHIGADIEDTIVNHFICQQGLFFRTELIRALHGVREELHFVMDLDLFTRALIAQGLSAVREIPEVIAFFRQHKDAKTALATAKFLQEERRVFHGIGMALGLARSLLDRIATPSASFAFPDSITRLNPDRLSEALALKFWWNGTVEAAWQKRDFQTFCREARAFVGQFPNLRTPRIDRLSLAAHLPAALLRLSSVFRSSVTTS